MTGKSFSGSAGGYVLSERWAGNSRIAEEVWLQ